MNWKGLERMLEHHLESYCHCPGQRRDTGRTEPVTMVKTGVKRRDIQKVRLTGLSDRSAVERKAFGKLPGISFHFHYNFVNHITFSLSSKLNAVPRSYSWYVRLERNSLHMLQRSQAAFLEEGPTPTSVPLKAVPHQYLWQWVTPTAW